ncbi:hypothetical protein [Paenibacillus lautus]|uniref:hypothetical protein n=1 Tax=Paenibacillus lautus TaxID=1401 RepID=UPI003D29FBAD
MKSGKLNGKEDTIAVVYKFGNTIVKINTTYVCKTPEEREKVDRDIAMAGWAIINEIIARGEDV